MKLKKILAVSLATVFMTTAGVSAVFATTTNNSVTDSNRTFISNRMDKMKRPELTDEQKEALETRRNKMLAAQEKWVTLTDEQKEEIYSLREEIIEIEGRIIDKYSGWDVIDEEMVTQLKERLVEKRANMYENDRMPMFGGKGQGRKKFN